MRRAGSFWRRGPAPQTADKRLRAGPLAAEMFRPASFTSARNGRRQPVSFQCSRRWIAASSLVERQHVVAAVLVCHPEHSRIRSTRMVAQPRSCVLVADRTPALPHAFGEGARDLLGPAAIARLRRATDPRRGVGGCAGRGTVEQAVRVLVMFQDGGDVEPLR